MAKPDQEPSADYSIKRGAIEFYTDPENDDIYVSLIDFYNRYCGSNGDIAPTGLVGDKEYEFAEVLCMGVTPEYQIIVLRSTQEGIPEIVDKQEVKRLAYQLAVFDPEEKSLEYPVSTVHFGELDSSIPAAQRLTQTTVSCQLNEKGQITKKAGLYLTSQGGWWTGYDGKSQMLDNALWIPQLVQHERSNSTRS